MSKTLILYYSNTGTIARVSQELATMCGADTYEVKPIKDYDANMWTAWEVAKKEREQQHLPQLATPLPDLTPYDTIILGIPVWGFTLANPLLTLLKQLDFQGKAVSAFWSFYDHDEKVVPDLTRLLKNGTYTHGLPLTQSVIHNQGQLKQKLEEFTATITA